MRRLAGLAVLLALLLPAGGVVADELSDLATQTKLWTERVKLADQRKLFAQHRKAEAEALRDAVAAELKQLQDSITKQQTTPTPKVPNIRIVSASLVVDNGTAEQSCNAAPFMRYTCHGVDSCPIERVDDKICGIPTVASAPMLLNVTYRCNEQVIEDAFPFLKPAYLTCK